MLSAVQTEQHKMDSVLKKMSSLPSLAATAISSRNNSSFIAAQVNRIRSSELTFAQEKIKVFVRL